MWQGAFVSSSNPPESLLICIATFNERENLPLLLEEIRSFTPWANVLIIDDNSPDGTGNIADDIASKDSKVQVIHRAGKLGLGTAILAGIRYAMEKNYDLFLTMDADFSHRPRYLIQLLEGMRHHDIMIGSRYVPGGGVKYWPWTRQFMSKGVNC